MSQCSLAVALAVFFAIVGNIYGGNTPDYSKEAAVIESITTTVEFNAQGARHSKQVLSVRLQSEGAVRQYGVLSFAYASANQQLSIDYVRVRKADGSLVETPQSSIVDLATNIAAGAPTYNDIRQKQIPVKALGAGDVLEYSIQISESAPEVPGHFWFSQSLLDDMVVLSETVEAVVPAAQYVQVSSPGVKPEIHDGNAQRTYVWRHSHLDPSKPAEKNDSADKPEPPKIELTTFRNWDEVGSWFATLAEPQAAATPVIRAKAKELTAGLSSNSEKARALYNFVAMKFRYISISLGVGRYRPHSAEEVLANQYGDCKDKHTLLVALLKAEGIEAWPALIGAGLKLNAEVPSPAAFNHVITVIPENGNYVWLDTTAEVAPYGFISQVIRDEQALVIPNSGKAFLQKTPVNPPSPAINSITSRATLSADGTLAGHFEWRSEGDVALTLRTVFRQLAPAQWQSALQQLSYALGFAGDVSAVEVQYVEDIGKPFQYAYDYNRKQYSGWAEHKITLPLPQLNFGPGVDADKPKEPFWAGQPGTFAYRDDLRLPAGFTLDVPSDVSLTTDFADYSAHYSLTGGTLACERKLIIKQAKVSLEQWPAYQKFMKDLQADQTTFISLDPDSADAEANRPSVRHRPTDDDINPEAQALIGQAMQAMQKRQLPEARNLLAQAEKLNPKEPRLWSMYAHIALLSEQKDEGLKSARKEIELHPNEVDGYGELAFLLTQAGRRDEAIEAWHKALELSPANQVIAQKLVALLLDGKRYAEIAPSLDKSIAAAPANYRLRAMRVQGLLKTGDHARALTEAQEIAKATMEPLILNDLAYDIADNGLTTPSVIEWMERAIRQTEEACAKVSLASLEQKDVANTNILAAEWDTLGWIYFKTGNSAKAEKYVDAAWRLSQHSDMADHLGQIYEHQGRQAKAIHMWRLALAEQNSNEDAKEHLRRAGAPLVAPVAHVTSAKQQNAFEGEELGRLRTIGVPGLAKNTPEAEYFVTISRQGVQEIEIASDSEMPESVNKALRAAKFNLSFPDDGSEKIVRRGVLSCSAYTDPNCQFTMFPLSTTTIAGAPKGAIRTNGQTPASVADPDVVGPSLISKVEPQYSEAARHAGLEGRVLLKITIDEQGLAQNIEVVKSLGRGLDESAKACVMKWRFKPATKNGKAIQSPAHVEVNFKLLRSDQ
jgi:TonB family protein